jgi:hypothetical protein
MGSGATRYDDDDRDGRRRQRHQWRRRDGQRSQLQRRQQL